MHHVIDRLRCRLALSSAAIALCVAAVMPAAPARAEGVPAGLRGTWSLDCANPNAAQLMLEAANVTLVTAGRRHAYAGVEVSYTWVGGARASGDRVWLLISKAPNGPFAFVIATTRGKRPVLVLEEGHPEHGREARRLFGAKFLRCTGAPAQSDRSDAPAAGADKRAALDVEVMEEGGDGQAANCMSQRGGRPETGRDARRSVRPRHAPSQDRRTSQRRGRHHFRDARRMGRHRLSHA